MDEQPDQEKQVLQLLDEVRKEVAVLIPPAYNRFPNSFSHIFAGGYAAGYYAYSWTEMLDHDAYAWFVENGGMTRKNGQHIRDTILSQGHSKDYTVMYRNFAGRDPRVEPMLKARGLK